jgi:hypothetical protein
MIPSQHTPDEIGKLRQDLENLERCYAVLEQGGRRVKTAYFVYLGALAVLTIGGIFLENGLVMSATSFMVLILSIIVALLADMRGTRWIDVVGWRPGFLGGGEAAGLVAVVRRSEAQAVEDMIAERKMRLASLRQEQS